MKNERPSNYLNVENRGRKREIGKKPIVESIRRPNPNPEWYRNTSIMERKYTRRNIIGICVSTVLC